MSLGLTYIKSVIIVLLLTMLLYCCKKDYYDYRRKFIGKYYFFVKISGFNCITGTWDTSYNYNGQIIYGSGNNFIKIENSNGGFEEVQLYEDGTLTNFDKIYGEFETIERVRFHKELSSQCTFSFITVTGDKTK
jgi:hypothetical protein